MNTPPRAVRLLIGFSPGSLSDNIARALAKALAQVSAIAMTIEPRPGDNGVPAARAVAASAPDGNTLFMATLCTHAITPILTSPYDPLHDFTPVSLLTQSPMLLAIHPSHGVRSMPELIARAQAGAVPLSYATSAVGGAPHLSAELFQALTGVRMRHVRYDQTEQLYRDLEAGKVDLSFNNINTMLPRCRCGALVALGVTSAQRSPAAPDIPTLAEAGVAGFEMTNWTAVVAPRNTPPQIVAEISMAIGKALAAENIAAAFAADGITPHATTPAGLADFIAAELARWRDIASGFQPADERR